MMHTHPRHNIKNPPGQIVNKIETLGDYIKHVEEQEFPKKKLTFAEWVLEGKSDAIAYLGLDKLDEGFAGESWYMFELLWKAAQENV